ncbi:Protein aveugle [Eumeta japonica]|uniref:Protein aveugle n=1 Tax=Eumeta variegata TaxID=151549 RepID=A0A4C1UMI7_EUMVA|nr:Protein aveugle [Eumeta japonica]
MHMLEYRLTGSALVRLYNNTLIRMGLTNCEHHEAIWREIQKLRLKTDILEIMDLGLPHDCHTICDIKTTGNVAITH